MDKSPSHQAKQIEQEVNIALRKFDLSRLGTKERDDLLDLKRDLANARLYVNSYELSETRQEQESNAKFSRQWLAKANKKILAASEYNIFGPADVAHLSAQIDQLKSELK
jgi:hypothetical protein